MGVTKKYDFGGYATRNNLRCSDGRIIRKGAFKDQDGEQVPMVYMHSHDDVNQVLGHAVLEDREDGVYAYCSFNDTESGRNAKSAVEHGDIRSLSIHANNLVQKGTSVLHGAIREVSLVLAGANPGALIDNLVIEHADGSMVTVDDEAWIYSGIENFKFYGEDEDVLNHSEELSHAEDEETLADVINTMSDKQQDAMAAVIAMMISDEEEDEEELDHYDEEGEDFMKRNVFDAETEYTGDVLTHADLNTITHSAMRDIKKYGSLRDAFAASLEHEAADYGIENIEYLFPDNKNINNVPDFIQREQSWVKKVMNGVHHTPFARIKSTHADITADEARAKGYTKGKRKIEEVFTLLKRTTDPQTIYKKQKFDRDDIIDITDFDVIAWVKGEMRMMLEEEIARAILIGDGRLAASDDKIDETHVRPILTDDTLYSIKVGVELESNEKGETAEAEQARANKLIRAIIKARRLYKGSGSPTLFISETDLTIMRLVEDGIGHLKYDTMDKLATVLNVREIVPVPVMENITTSRTPEGSQTAVTYTLAGIMVNLADYNVGADKGGSVSMFEDFDIDYNQQKYLIETRISGALVKPLSALVFEYYDAE